MSGRENDIFTFTVDDWIQELVAMMRNQVNSHLGKLGSKIEQHALTQLSEELESREPEEGRAIKNSLRTEIKEIITLLGTLVTESLDLQSDILATYLKSEVFFVPPDSIMAVSPLQVPIPVSTKDASKQMDLTESNKTKATQEEQTTLKEILLKVHKAEYFISRLKQLTSENEQYIIVLQSILHSLIQLEEMVKANDTEGSIQKMTNILQTGWNTLHEIQTVLKNKGVDAGLNLTPMEVTMSQ